MPILTLQKSMRRLGRIRMGSQVPTSNGNTRPNKLETWRLTSPFRELLDAAAVMYGGEVTEWTGSPSGQQWELFTEARALEVVIPPGDMAFSQWYELWSGGGCMRRCDGQTEITSGEACMCPADPDERITAAGKGHACKPTTRLFVIQPRLPDVGLWHFESHGFYAATELPGTINIIRTAAVGGSLIPARLTIEQRSVKRDGQTNNFAVPVIELPTLTTHSLMSGEIVGGQLPSGEPAALTAPVGEIGAGVDDTPPAEAQPPAPVESGTSPRAARSASSRGTQPPPPAAPPASTGDGPRPLPSAGTGDGATFRRAILGKAQRLALDGDALDALAQANCGKPFAEISSPKDGNTLLAALDERVAS